MARFAVSTNLNGTINLAVRDSAPLWLAAFRSSAEVGYFKLAQNLTLMAMMPIDLFIWPTYSEIVQTVALRQWQTTRRLLKRVSGLAALYVTGAAGGLALLGWWLIPLLYKPESAPAYPALLILLAGYGFANIFNWNRPLLLALGRPGFPLAVMAAAGALEIALMHALVPAFGKLAHAAILSGFFIVSICVIVWQGLRLVRRHETAGEIA
jgi:O-antigen/teichoic acid export membrane protein